MARHQILYVEDDDAAFELVRIVLDDEFPQTQISRARDGEEALQLLLAKLSDGLPGLILLDLNLPRMSGLELLFELKARETLQAIPVVMFSTSAAASDRRRALAAGAREYITKPPSLDLFIEAVRQICSLPSDPDERHKSRSV